MKGSGKSTLARHLARKYDLYVYSLSEKKRDTESEAQFLQELLQRKAMNIIIDATEHTPLSPETRQLLGNLGPVVLLDLNPDVNFARLASNGLPDYGDYRDNPRQIFDELLLQRMPSYQSAADIILRLNTESETETLRKFINLYEL